MSSVRIPSIKIGQEDGILTSPPLSLPALAFSASGDVLLGSKAAFSVAAAASSEPDLEYSFGSGLRLSLDWASLRARGEGELVKGREIFVVVVAAAVMRVVLGRARERRKSCILVGVVWVEVWLERGIGLVVWW